MLVSTPPKPFNDHRNKTHESSMSPKYNHHRSLFTPKSKGPAICDPPSPLRNRPLFSLSTNIPDSDDMIQSPFKSLPLAPPYNTFFSIQPQTIPADDEEGNIFLSTAAPTAQVPLTPLKQPRRVPSNAVLSARQQSTVAPLGTYAVSRSAAGTKRKSTTITTPLRHHNLTPLRSSHSAKLNDSGISFDRLAPLPSPKFGANTPQSKAETDAHLRCQTDTLTRLRLSDPEVIDFDDAANDSGCEMDQGSAHRSPTIRKQSKSHAGRADEEVAEAGSPGGHIAKRRARSRPVSFELREGALISPTKFPLKSVKPSGIPCRIGGTRPRHSGTVTFPSLAHRGRASPGSLSTSSEAGSPRPRRRISGISRPEPLPPLIPRAPMNRIESNSSATLFFGPSIPRPSPAKPRSRTSSKFSSSTPAPSTTNLAARPVWSNRHSYAGPATDSVTWNTFQRRNTSPSPGTSPDKGPRDNSMDDEDMFFAGEESSFVLNVINNTPSPPKAALPNKFKPSDSLGVNDEDEMPSLISFPRDSNSVSSFSDDGLVTPLCGPDSASGWPIAPAIVTGVDPHTEQGIGIDEFIQKTLADASKGSSMPKKAPGTPVKKTRISYFGHERPWQSAIATKVGLKDDVEFKKAPRKSLPAVFPPMSNATARANKLSTDWQPTDTEDDEEYSPSTRRDRYPGLGLGQPHTNQVTGKPDMSLMWSRWPGIIRRSSSGAFSSGSESASLANTPTRTKGTDWQLPKPRLPLRFSPSSDWVGKAFRSSSGSSNSSSISSPTANKTKVTNTGVLSTTTDTQAGPSRPRVTNSRRPSDICMEEEQPGRFERDFDEVEEIGSGEFGKVMKVKNKNGSDGVLSAVKRSKSFEGAKHRLRLREEVDILKHLSQAALSHSYAGGRHPNILGYIDSWEENEALYIRTELCEYGNLARFLWEYGRVFPCLDEAKVWKVMADLSSGLRFIHSAGVIHLDLKPSNVFVTKEGRFKIGDFGMASLWPRGPAHNASSDEGIRSASESGSVALQPVRGCDDETIRTMTTGGFEREGDKLYLAPEVLQGCYSKAADVFSLGMTILEAASNIVVPDQGEAWHRLRNEDFSQVHLEHSQALVDLIQQMMRTDPTQRLTSAEVESYPPVCRARARMEVVRLELSAQDKNIWGASPLASVPPGFLEDILGTDSMDTS